MRQTVALLAVCSLVTITVGCSQNMGTVRGQAPGQYQAGPHPMAPQGQMASNGGMRMPGPSPETRYYDGPAFDPNQFGPSNCPPGPHGSSCPVCPQSHSFDVWRPTHHHTWEYNAPQGLTYPNPTQPPAAVQYPYYTVKGPTDFFMK
ncbi:MAG: hypothetical protein O3B13_07435 [Planctomycetota bacterium]|nr:hypothetical protein [Planctomycetota bacterium]MDA1162917.1 hypothetical protein [Planctomycetota bacterium]